VAAGTDSTNYDGRILTMSRSYKKVPYCGQRNRKGAKAMANRHFRRVAKINPDSVGNHNSYKKQYSSWDICDWYWLCSWSEYWQNELKSYNHLCMAYPDRDWPKPDKKKSYRRWLKYHRSK
jgi:hypothetical protein